MRTSWQKQESFAQKCFVCRKTWDQKHRPLIKSSGKGSRALSFLFLFLSHYIFEHQFFLSVFPPCERNPIIGEIWPHGGGKKKKNGWCNLWWNMSQWTLIHHMNRLWRLRFLRSSGTRQTPHPPTCNSTRPSKWWLFLEYVHYLGFNLIKGQVWVGEEEMSARRDVSDVCRGPNGPCIDGQMEEGG